MPHSYETDGAAIYLKSFAMIRAEADLARFAPEEEQVAVRMIHAAGMVDLAADIWFSPGFVQAARGALNAGAPILCDARMVSEGVTLPRLPAGNQVICTLQDPTVPDLAKAMANTRSAAALELWRPHLGRLAGGHRQCANRPVSPAEHAGRPRLPAPGGHYRLPGCFVGAMESKDALWQAQPVPCVIVRGRKGGSAITVAAINAVASTRE